MSVPPPLAGVRILAAEQLGAGPFGTLQLADLGADVIKIENPAAGGDSSRLVSSSSDSDKHRPGNGVYFQSFNRNKRSITLNLRSSEGQKILHLLVAHADAVFNNLRGDLPDKLGLRYCHLKTANPRIVCVSLSGYGPQGRLAAEPGYDYLFQALTGMMSITGEPGTPPARSGVPIVDLAGGLIAMLGLLSGLVAARRDGVGRDVDVSLLDSALSLLSYVGAWALNDGYRVEKLARSQHPSLVPVGVFPTLDGSIVLMCMKQTFFERLCAVIGAPQLSLDKRFRDPSGRLRHRDELNALLDGVLVKRTTSEWLSEFRGKIPCAPVHDIAQALADPDVAAADMIWQLSDPDFGNTRVIASPIRMTGASRAAHRAPFLAEHLDVVLGEVGIGPKEISRLRRSGVV